MSLGGIAIAIGAMIDAAIVMIENAHKHLERLPPQALPAGESASRAGKGEGRDGDGVIAPSHFVAPSPPQPPP